MRRRVTALRTLAVAQRLSGRAGEDAVTHVRVVEPAGHADGMDVDGTAPHWLAHVLRAVALGLGALHTTVAVTRQSMNEDGINYLDAGTAVTSGDWSTALNAIWSPLYSAILGIVLWLVQPSAWWEFPVVQVTNFVIFACTIRCFEFFWQELTATYHAGSGPFVRFPPAAWLVLGYSLFIWSSLALINVWSVTPDMLVAACVYVAGGLLLRGERGPCSRGVLVGFGAVLGVGYLAKAALFPLGLMCLLLVAGVLHARFRTAPRVAWALLGFGVVAGPMVLTLSVVAGHPTFGDVGRFTYMKHVNRLRYPHWEETIANVNGTPRNPPRVLVETPRVYAFGSPVPGTYPLAFDPGYWTAGLSPRIEAAQQFTAFVSNGRYYFDLVLRQQGLVVGVVLLVLVCAARPRERPSPAVLVLWASTAFALYSLVYVAPRYVAPFVVLFWAGLLACARFQPGPHVRRLAAAACWILLAGIWINIAAANADGFGRILSLPGLPSDPAFVPDEPARPVDRHPAIAEGLLQAGLARGDSVGFIGHSFTAFWARLARLRIVAEMEPRHASSFWSSDRVVQEDVLRAFASAGAVAVVAEPRADHVVPPGWSRVPGSEYLVYLLHH